MNLVLLRTHLNPVPLHQIDKMPEKYVFQYRKTEIEPVQITGAVHPILDTMSEFGSWKFRIVFRRALLDLTISFR